MDGATWRPVHDWKQPVKQHDTSKSPNKRIRLHSLTKSNTIVLSDGSSSDTDDNGCDEAWQPENNALDGTGSEDSDSSGRKQVSNYALDVGSKLKRKRCISYGRSHPSKMRNESAFFRLPLVFRPRKPVFSSNLLSELANFARRSSRSVNELSNGAMVSGVEICSGGEIMSSAPVNCSTKRTGNSVILSTTGSPVHMSNSNFNNDEHINCIVSRSVPSKLGENGSERSGQSNVPFEQSKSIRNTSIRNAQIENNSIVTRSIETVIKKSGREHSGSHVVSFQQSISSLGTGNTDSNTSTSDRSMVTGNLSDTRICSTVPVRAQELSIIDQLRAKKIKYIVLSAEQLSKMSDRFHDAVNKIIAKNKSSRNSESISSASTSAKLVFVELNDLSTDDISSSNNNCCVNNSDIPRDVGGNCFGAGGTIRKGEKNSDGSTSGSSANSTLSSNHLAYDIGGSCHDARDKIRENEKKSHEINILKPFTVESTSTRNNTLPTSTLGSNSGDSCKNFMVARVLTQNNTLQSTSLPSAKMVVFQLDGSLANRIPSSNTNCKSKKGGIPYNISSSGYGISRTIMKGEKSSDNGAESDVNSRFNNTGIAHDTGCSSNDTRGNIKENAKRSHERNSPKPLYMASLSTQNNTLAPSMLENSLNLSKVASTLTQTITLSTSMLRNSIKPLSVASALTQNNTLSPPHLSIYNNFRVNDNFKSSELTNEDSSTSSFSSNSNICYDRDGSPQAKRLKTTSTTSVTYRLATSTNHSNDNMKKFCAKMSVKTYEHTATRKPSYMKSTVSQNNTLRSILSTSGTCKANEVYADKPLMALGQSATLSTQTPEQTSKDVTPFEKEKQSKRQHAVRNSDKRNTGHASKDLFDGKSNQFVGKAVAFMCCGVCDSIRDPVFGCPKK